MCCCAAICYKYYKDFWHPTSDPTLNFNSILQVILSDLFMPTWLFYLPSIATMSRDSSDSALMATSALLLCCAIMSRHHIPIAWFMMMAALSTFMMAGCPCCAWNRGIRQMEELIWQWYKVWTHLWLWVWHECERWKKAFYLGWLWCQIASCGPTRPHLLPCTLCLPLYQGRRNLVSTITIDHDSG